MRHSEAMENLAWLLLAAIASALGGYFGSYLRKKGENLATHEDFQTVLTELRETTRTTKEIEAKISHEVWDRQRKWEVKKEVLFDMGRGLVDLDNALVQLRSVENAKKKRLDLQEERWLFLERKALRACSDAEDSLQRISLLEYFTVGSEVLLAFSKTNNLLKSMTAKMGGGDVEGAIALDGPMRESMSELIARIRAELGVD